MEVLPELSCIAFVNNPSYVVANSAVLEPTNFARYEPELSISAVISTDCPSWRFESCVMSADQSVAPLVSTVTLLPDDCNFIFIAGAEPLDMLVTVATPSTKLSSGCATVIWVAVIQGLITCV